MKRVCLFAGINGNLGNAFRKLYADQYIIVGVGRSDRAYDDIDYLKGDVLTESEGIANYVFGRYGKVDLLINSTCKIDISRFDKKNAQSIKEELEQNVLAPINIIHALLHSKWGNSYSHYNKVNNTNVVNLSSMAGNTVVKVGPRLGDRFGYSTYCAAKAFIDSFTMNVANELNEYNIRINAVAPCTFSPAVIDKTCKIIEYIDKSDQNGQVYLIPAEQQISCLHKPEVTID